MSMSDILAALLFLLIPLRHSKADCRMAKDTLIIIIIIIIIIMILIENLHIAQDCVHIQKCFTLH